jgi:iron complex outermembrane receptor protein
MRLRVEPHGDIKRLRLILKRAALLCILLYAPFATAEPPEAPLKVPTVNVEGHQHLADDAAPSTVITRSDMSDSMADLPELLDESPGLRTTRLGGLGSYATVSIRGSTTEQVHVFIDGIPLNSAEGGPVNLGSLPLGPLESIVVYRGISPVRFGGSAIGGVVSIHTREVEEPSLELEAGGGHFDTRLARAFFGLSGKRWNFAASVDYLGSAGDFDFVDDNGTRFDTTDDVETSRQNNAFDQIATLAKGRFQLSKSFALQALNLTTWRNSGLAGRANLQTKAAELEQVRTLSALRLEGTRLGNTVDLALTTYLSWSETRFSDPLNEIGIGKDSTRDTSLTPGVNLLLNIPISFDELDEWGMRISATSEYRFEEFNPGNTSPASPAGQASNRHFVTTAGELNLWMDPLDLELVTSLRWERIWSTLNTPKNVSSLQGSPDDRSGDDVFTWRAALVQRSIPSTELSVNVSSSVRFPSLYELFGNTGAVLGNPSLKPEKGLTLDVGILHRAAWLPDDWTWTLEGHVFHTQLEDLIQFTQNAQGVARADNVDSARMLGVELGSYADLFRHVRIRMSYTWMDTENTGRIKSRQGKQLPLRPEHKVYASLAGYFQFSLWALQELGVSVDIEHLSGNYLDATNLVELPERTIWGASIYGVLLDGQLRTDISFRNVGDSQVIDLIGYPLPGFSVMATLRYSPKLSTHDQTQFFLPRVETPFGYQREDVLNV